MFRAYRVMTSPNFGSMMAWMVWLYTGYTIIMLVELWLAMRADLSLWQSEPRLARPDGTHALAFPRAADAKAGSMVQALAQSPRHRWCPWLSHFTAASARSSARLGAARLAYALMPILFSPARSSQAAG